MKTRFTRPPAVAGVFYPAAPAALRDEIARCLAAAPRDDEGAAAPKMLFVPHAGTVYSGPVAACAYAPLERWRDRFSRVVLLGPAHRVSLRGIAASGASAFATPLGAVPVDAAAVASLAGLDGVVVDDRAHAAEHALEVQLPFLQTVLASFKLVPLVVGDAGAATVAAVLDRLWGGDETLIVISTDLSHYLPYAAAQQRDRATVARMLALEPDLDPDDACGAYPVNGALLQARRKRLQARLLDLRNSADTAGDPARVVGYGAISFGGPA